MMRSGDGKNNHSAMQTARLFTMRPIIWDKDWGVHLQPFGSGESAIKYLCAYVCRTAIGDSRIVAIHGDNVMFRWKDRANNNAPRTDTIPGVEFVTRYLRHLLDFEEGSSESAAVVNVFVSTDRCPRACGGAGAASAGAGRRQTCRERSGQDWLSYLRVDP